VKATRCFVTGDSGAVSWQHSSMHWQMQVPCAIWYFCCSVHLDHSQTNSASFCQGVVPVCWQAAASDKVTANSSLRYIYIEIVFIDLLRVVTVFAMYCSRVTRSIHYAVLSLCTGVAYSTHSSNA